MRWLAQSQPCRLPLISKGISVICIDAGHSGGPARRAPIDLAGAEAKAEPLLTTTCSGGIDRVNQTAISVSQFRLWRKRLADLGRAAGAAQAVREVAVLRTAVALLTDAPAGCVDWLPGQPDFEAMLAVGTAASAALALLPQAAGFMLSRGLNGRVLASVILPGGRDDVVCEASSPALAMVAALCGALGGDARAPDALTLPPRHWLN
jgi:hypothetical protein